MHAFTVRVLRNRNSMYNLAKVFLVMWHNAKLGESDNFCHFPAQPCV